PDAQLGIPAGAWAAMYSSPFASAGASSLATAVAMLAFIHFWVGHGGWPFSPQPKVLGAAGGVAMLVTTGVAGGGLGAAGATGAGVSVAATIAVVVVVVVVVAVAVAVAVAVVVV